MRFFLFLICIHTVLLNAQPQLQCYTKNKLSSIVHTNDTMLIMHDKYTRMEIPFEEIDSIFLGAVYSFQMQDAAWINIMLNRVRYEADSTALYCFNELLPLNEAILKDIQKYIAQFSTNDSGANLERIHKLYDSVKRINGFESHIHTQDILILKNGNRYEGIATMPSITVSGQPPGASLSRNEYRSISFKKYRKQKIDKVKRTLLIAADTFITANDTAGWLNTKQWVNAGQIISIEVSGTIELVSMAGLKYTADGAILNSSPPTDDKMYPGQLLFRIGNSDVKKTGLSLKHVCAETGIIQFSIYETIKNAMNTGQYRVKLTIE